MIALPVIFSYLETFSHNLDEISCGDTLLKISRFFEARQRQQNLLACTLQFSSPLWFQTKNKIFNFLVNWGEEIIFEMLIITDKTARRSSQSEMRMEECQKGRKKNANDWHDLKVDWLPPTAIWCQQVFVHIQSCHANFNIDFFLLLLHKLYIQTQMTWHEIKKSLSVLYIY